MPPGSFRGNKSEILWDFLRFSIDLSRKTQYDRTVKVEKYVHFYIGGVPMPDFEEKVV